MKATGIVRRIDELGRVVVPKEIRRTLRIHEGDPLEIFTDKEGEIVLKKYSPMGEVGSLVKDLCHAIWSVEKCSIGVCDRDKVLAATGSFANGLKDGLVDSSMKYLMEERIRYDGQGMKTYYAGEEHIGKLRYAQPIIAEGDVTGCVFLIEDGTKKMASEIEKKMVEVLTTFLGSQMES